jgi:hypothetical protein
MRVIRRNRPLHLRLPICGICCSDTWVLG